MKLRTETVVVYWCEGCRTEHRHWPAEPCCDPEEARCLCDRHSSHRKDHGGPCCGVAGGLCIVCR